MFEYIQILMILNIYLLNVIKTIHLNIVDKFFFFFKKNFYYLNQ
jgi:hypothetical protein